MKTSDNSSMKDYRISKSREEIIKLVQKKFEAENIMTIWQKDPATEERTFKCDVKFAALEAHEGFFSIAIDEAHKEKFNPKLETYFLLKVQDFVFKTKTAITQNPRRDGLNFQIPQDVRLKELRIHPRVYINLEDRRLVAAKFESKNNDKNGLAVECPIYNISQSGICIIVSKETLSNIKLGEVIELEGLSFFKTLANEMKAVVRNARVYAKQGFGKEEHYALGLEFQIK